MKFPTDFDAVPELVRGFAQAEVPLKWDQLEMAVRKAVFKGRGDILFKILEETQWNGVRATRIMYREAMKGFLLQASIPDRREVIQAVKRSRRMRRLIAKQDLIMLGEWKAARAAEKKDRNPLRNEPPIPFHTDPVALGILTGIMARASDQIHDGLDYNAFIALNIGKLLGKQSWPQLQKMLSNPPPDLEGAKYRDRREQIHRNLHSIRDLKILADALKHVAAVLSKTSQFLVSPTGVTTDSSSVLPVAQSKYRKSPKEHALAIAQLVKNIHLELPILEQNTEKWEKCALTQVMDVFHLTEDKAREKLANSIHSYDDALEEMKLWVSRKAETEEVEQEGMDEAYEEDPEELKEEEVA